MNKFVRLLSVAMAASVMVAAFAVPAVAGASGTFLSRINSSRAAAGKAPVEMYWDLTDDAKSHTNAMINKGEIYHNSSLSGVTSVWQKLGENVGVGVDANQLHDAFMASSAHKRNILGDYNYVGIGAKTDANGTLWVTVVFMKAPAGLNGGGDTTTTTTTAAPKKSATTTTTAAPKKSATTTTTAAPMKSATTTTMAETAGSNAVPETEVEDSGETSRPKTEGFGHPSGRAALAF